MLRQLQIESYGLIERAEIEFTDGATIFTGETGSGKTMLLGALDFALGARAGADVVRRGARRAAVSLEFEPDDALRDLFTAGGFGLDPGETASIAREMTESGRSTLRVNGRPATAAYVREVRDSVVEIVGQHEAQRLLSPAYHLEVLDRFAGDSALAQRDAVATAYARAREAARALASLESDERGAQERSDDARFACSEIESARLEPGEDVRLNERRVFLDNVERIALALQSAREALAAEEGGAVAALGAAASALAAVGTFDGELKESAQRASALQSEAIELAAGIVAALEAAEYDPAELDAINARLDAIDRLKRKYGATIEEILAYAARARAVVDAHEHRDRTAAALAAAAAAEATELRRAAGALRATRVKAAAALVKRVRAEFAEIALASARFDVALETLAEAAEHGGDRVEFLFAANNGEPLRPLSRVASGGELSRVLLALVVALAGSRDARGALIFDEIDAGIGGATATAVGARIGDLKRRGQVVCVTHLAQLATWADRHYVLDKIETKKETTIAVRALSGAKQREAEIARMLSGESHDVALRHARSLLSKSG
jgi:DNA repair protein RecN (Recombination protein N)